MRIALLLLCLRLGAQDFAEVEKVAREELAARRIPGAAVGIVRGGRLVFAQGFGVASVETKAPVTPDMLFRLGSTTKMFTAAAVAGLALEEKLSLEAPLGKYLAFLPPGVGRATAHQLLTHTAGIMDAAVMNGSHDDDALGAGIRGWTDAYLFTQPGRIFSYSNPGYWLAGYLAESVAGKPYADVLKERLFDPLGMRRTTLRPLVAMTYPLAQGHDGGGIVRPAADNVANWPAGSIFSSVEDLARFTVAFLNKGQLEGREALSPALIAKLSTPYVRIAGSPNSYGYGLTVAATRGVRMVSHGGSRLGYGSSIQMAPDHGVAVIVLANLTGASLPKTVEKALELLLPPEPKAAPPAKRVTAGPADAGVYVNGSQKIELAWKDGRISPPGDFVLVRDAAGRAEYLCRGSRCLKRQ